MSFFNTLIFKILLNLKYCNFYRQHKP